MRTTWRAWGTMLGAVVLAVVTSGDRARAEDERTTGAWVFDVRVVRVFSGAAENAEKGPPWSADSPPVETPWAEVLASLKARGEVLVLLDRRVTAVEGAVAEVADSQSFPIQRFERRDDNNQTHVSGSLETGISAHLTASPGLQYRIEARWAVEPPLGATYGGATGLAKWAGSWPRLDGKTLVLGHRQQIARAGDAGTAPLTVEIYALVTGRFVP